MVCCHSVLLPCKWLGCMQRRAVLAREALAKEGKLEATLQACAEGAARRNTPFFVLPQGRVPSALTLQPLDCLLGGVCMLRVLLLRDQHIVTLAFFAVC